MTDIPITNNSFIPDFSIDHSLKPTYVYTIDVQDAIAHMQYQYALAILLVGCAGVLYVLWNNFVRQPGRYNDKYVFERYGVIPIIENSKASKISEELDTLAIMPVLYLAVVGISYFTGFKGV